MTSHQAKKLDIDALLEFRDRFDLPLTNAQVEALDFVRPPDASPEIEYLHDRRRALGGLIPTRRTAAPKVSIPRTGEYAEFALAADGKEMSTTVAAVRLLSNLLKDSVLGPRLVPIVADEARTFGMANLFRQVGIYSPSGQLYEPEDAGSMLSYREAVNGQLLEEGITEAGALSSWVAAATAYSTHGMRMLPVYIYYSMFGFQRVGDLIWAAADQRARGFLIGATAGKTTLGGEGLQHQDGVSHLIASTIPNCRAYDPAYAYELTVIMDHGARRMLEEDNDEFYYLTAMNETYPHPSLPTGAEADIIRGLHRLSPKRKAKAQARLLGSGAILQEVRAAADLLKNDWDIDVDVFSATSYPELAREAQEIERANLFGIPGAPRRSHIATLLPGSAPVIAATDYVRALPQLIAPFIEGRFIALGADGFGRSDTRTRLREFFEVSRFHIILATLGALAEPGGDNERLARAITRYGLSVPFDPSWKR